MFPYWTNGEGYETSIRPFLESYCVSCHGPDKQKATLRFDRLDSDIVNGMDADVWQEALDLINVGEMPPNDADKQPSGAERRVVVEALTTSLRQAMEAKRSTGGRNILRRLTSYEYNNTLRDLLNLDIQYSADLPPEGSAKEGFKNNSRVLLTSALHLEYFERIARNALERIILVPETQPKPYYVRVEPELALKPKPKSKNSRKPRNAKKSTGFSYGIKSEHFSPGKKAKAPIFHLSHGELFGEGESILLAGNRPGDNVGDLFAPDRKIGGAKGDGRSGFQPEFRVEMYEIPYDVPVLVRIRASAIPGKNDTYPRLSFEFGSFRGAGVSDQKEAVNREIRSLEPRIYEFVAQGANFPFQSNKPSRPSYFRIFNDFRRGTGDLAFEEMPKLNIDWVEIESNHYETWPPAQRKAILFDSENQGNEALYVQEVLTKFMGRAYRRPVSKAEVDRKLALFQRLRSREDSFESSIISTLTAILCSPNFLLIAEPSENLIIENGANEKRRLNDYELASRLSYFLWSSMPDDRLFDLASRQRLQQLGVLRAQVKRMIADPKAVDFSRNFASQWLDLAGIRRLAVNPEYFDFEEKTKDLFEEESIQFVHHVLTEDLSIRNFIDSDFAILNPAMAKHYRIPGVSGGGFRSYPIKREFHRGGLMTQASMLFGNSTGAESHPIKRGVWVLERMLDDPPAPPPPNVPDLPEPEAVGETTLSLKERLAQHAQVESCRDCHSKIDPWGVAFENYNALGQWREGSSDPLVRKAYQQIKVDPSTRLKNGTKIHHLDDLKDYILTEKMSQFRRAFVRKVMAYSFGRYLEFSDQEAIESVCKSLEEQNDSFQALIEQVVLSEPFLTK